MTHVGALNYDLQLQDFDVDSHRSVLEIIYDEVKDTNSGPQLKIKLYLERLLGISMPKEFAVGQNYPNPFNGRTIIKYQLSGRSQVRLAIFDLLGRQIRTLIDEDKPGGVYSVTWDGEDGNGKHVSSGLYFYRLSSGSIEITKKMLLMK